MSDPADFDESVFRVVKWILVGALVIALSGLFLAALVVGSHAAPTQITLKPLFEACSLDARGDPVTIACPRGAWSKFVNSLPHRRKSK